MNPLIPSIYVWVAVSVLTWVGSTASKHAGWLDRIWAIMPVVYMWIFAVSAGLSDVRLNIIAVLVSAWGVRLTWNFARRGGFDRGAEDYRWAYLRERLSPAGWQIFNVLFISVYQNLLLFLLVVPAVLVFDSRGPMTVLDWICVALFLVFLVGESVADGQQWRFQQAKAVRLTKGLPAAGFVDTGLFRWSRHPNFFCEAMMWWVIYAFGVIASGQLLNWTIIGALLLSTQILSSTTMTERISAAKYPDYPRYQRTTSRLVPWPPRVDGDAARWRTGQGPTGSA